ncbi:nucleoside phosphorylase domain-containing protein [Hyaloscypha sp. PMI_1271]|nr:nucleoside phosphorylase domain-containing protein [Hyaloscypha sp. PMI_1271]
MVQPFKRDINTYTTGVVSRHNVILVYMPGIGKGSATSVASSFRSSFGRIKLALVIGIYGGVLILVNSEEILLGDLPNRFVRKDTLEDNLGRLNTVIRAFLSKLGGLRSQDRLYERTYRYKHHDLLSYTIYTKYMVMKSGEDRDEIILREKVLGFEMEGARVWDNFPYIVIKCIYDYIDSHKNKKWQGYTIAAAIAYMKAFLKE